MRLHQIKIFLYINIRIKKVESTYEMVEIIAICLAED